MIDSTAIFQGDWVAIEVGIDEDPVSRFRDRLVGYRRIEDFCGVERSQETFISTTNAHYFAGGKGSRCMTVAEYVHLRANIGPMRG